jgi:hypothetical protein
MMDTLLLATFPMEPFCKIFLFAGVSPNGFAPCTAVYTRFKAAAVWVRRGYLLRAIEYGGDVCGAERSGCDINRCQRRAGRGCVRPRGHAGRCICFRCWGNGTEHWFPKMHLCSKCNVQILGVPSPCRTMHWGCHRGSPPPLCSSTLLPEYITLCLL